MLINLRNALMAGKRLPYDAEVEYLESTGTQYIDIPVSVSAGQFFEVACTISAANLVSDAMLFDANVMRQFHVNRFSESSSSITFASCVGGVSQGGGLTITPNRMTTFALSTTGKTVDGVFTALARPLTSALSKIRIFGPIMDDFAFASVRFAAIKITVGDDVVFDGIPVRKGTVGYLYDRVSGKLFGNAGTGDFVLGPDVVPVEYIESHGTEYIDTEVIPGGKIIGAEITFKVLSYMGSGSTNGIFGSNANDGSDNYQFTIFNSQWRTKLANMGYYSGTPDKAVHALRLNSSSGTWLDNTNITPTTFTIPATNTRQLQLFSTNYASPSNFYHMVGCVYSCKIFDNNLVLRSFRPVRVGTDATSWEGAMMDVLTRRIYRNAGTGAFTYGNDLKYPIPSE